MPTSEETRELQAATPAKMDECRQTQDTRPLRPLDAWKEQKDAEWEAARPQREAWDAARRQENAKNAEWDAARPQREAKARRKLEAVRQQRKDVAGLKVHTTRSDVVLGVVVAWQIVLTVGLVYVALTGQPAEQSDLTTCPSPDE